PLVVTPSVTLLSPTPVCSDCVVLSCAYASSRAHRALHSFPTRRSSDLLAGEVEVELPDRRAKCVRILELDGVTARVLDLEAVVEDRKSTRLNSSHRTISYAVFRLKETNDMEKAARVAEIFSLRPRVSVH